MPLASVRVVTAYTRCAEIAQRRFHAWADNRAIGWDDPNEAQREAEAAFVRIRRNLWNQQALRHAPRLRNHRGGLARNARGGLS